MLYGSETWCVRENEVETLRRTEKAAIRVMRGVKLIEEEGANNL